MIGELFAGAGGVSEALRLLDSDEPAIGWELDADACATATAAGHKREQVDVAAADPSDLGDVEILVGAPPCQSFSVGGLKLGEDDPRGRLVHQVLRYARALRPRAIMCEQVPRVLPIWRAHALELEALGYSTAVGIVNALDHGVPQDRPRAVLVARRDGLMARLPRTGRQGSGMDVALPWDSGCVGFPRRADSGSVIEIGGQLYRARDLRATHRPSATVTGKARSWSRWTLDGEQRRVTLAEASVLQGFRPDYPWQGSRTSAFQQLANTTSPPLAAAVLRELI